MCLNPTTHVTNSKYINTSSVTSLYNTYNCGKCSECKQAKQTEFYYRVRAEYEHVKLNNGLCYWDTLTYSQENVPIYNPHSVPLFGRGYDCLSVNGMLCFNPSDYQLFMKRLRTNLTRLGYDVKNKLKYFITSEYGGVTHRPHYHILLFCDFSISPYVLETVLDNSWSLGRIDKSKTSLEKVVDGYGALKYVANYVTKDSEFEKVLNDIYPDIPQNELNRIKPFHRQSQGLGLSILGSQDYNYMFNNSKMQFWNENGFVEIPLPLYFIRKLFFKLEKDKDGLNTWKPTQEGIKWLKVNYINNFQRMEKRIITMFDNLNAPYVLEHYPKLPDVCRAILKERTLKHFTEYLYYYRGKVVNTSVLPTIDSMIDSIILSKSVDLSFLYQNNTFTYKRINNNYYGETPLYNTQLHELCITQDSYPEFHGFDDLFLSLNIINSFIDNIKEDNYKQKLSHRNRLKSIIKKYG